MNTLDLTVRFISLAVFFQGIELLQSKKYWSDEGIWSWNILKQEYSGLLQRLFGFFLQQKHFSILIWIQVALSILNVFLGIPFINGILFFLILFSVIRWRGTVNGGSDYMTALILLATFIAGFFPKDSVVQIMCFTYIGVQAILSYFVAGLTKLQHRAWYTGKALKQLLLHSNYLVDTTTKSLVSRPTLAFLASFVILIFECTFPLVLVDQKICLFYLGVALLFHIENFFVLGLNRFIFAWLAAYPSIYYLAMFFSSEII